MKRFLVVTRAAPYGSVSAREATDLALATALFDQSVALLFIDDGVFQLLKDQNPKEIRQKNVNAIHQALPLYDVDQLFVCEASLAARGLKTSDLAQPVKVMDALDLKALLAEQDHILHV